MFYIVNIMLYILYLVLCTQHSADFLLTNVIDTYIYIYVYTYIYVYVYIYMCVCFI